MSTSPTSPVRAPVSRVARAAVAGVVAVYVGAWLALTYWPGPPTELISFSDDPIASGLVEDQSVLTVGHLHAAALGVTLVVAGTVLLLAAATRWLGGARSA